MIPTLDENTLRDALSQPGTVRLDFWQETCAPCRALEPRLERFAREHPAPSARTGSTSTPTPGSPTGSMS